jgi:hypothetical protein
MLIGGLRNVIETKLFDIAPKIWLINGVLIVFDLSIDFIRVLSIITLIAYLFDKGNAVLISINYQCH